MTQRQIECLRFLTGLFGDAFDAGLSREAADRRIRQYLARLEGRRLDPELEREIRRRCGGDGPRRVI